MQTDSCSFAGGSPCAQPGLACWAGDGQWVPKGAGHRRAENWPLRETVFQTSGCCLWATCSVFWDGLPLPGPRAQGPYRFPSLPQKPVLEQSLKKANRLPTGGGGHIKCEKRLHLKKSFSSPKMVENP